VARPAGLEPPRHPPSESQSRAAPVPASLNLPLPRAIGREGYTRHEHAPAGDLPTPPGGSSIPRSVALAPAPRVGEAVRPVLPPSAPPGRDARVAPLSDAAVASRVHPSRDEGPVIHVTIDRIDVRAPAAATPRPARQRERAEPAV